MKSSEQGTVLIFEIFTNYFHGNFSFSALIHLVDCQYAKDLHSFTMTAWRQAGLKWVLFENCSQKYFIWNYAIEKRSSEKILNFLITATSTTQTSLPVFFVKHLRPIWELKQSSVMTLTSSSLHGLMANQLVSILLIN